MNFSCGGDLLWNVEEEFRITLLLYLKMPLAGVKLLIFFIIILEIIVLDNQQQLLFLIDPFDLLPQGDAAQ